ncbi:MAG TPA: peptidoglycan-binding protein [Candidatus Paceibacterota bacterium]|nr:peptidoglycan-binding protein [Candidatus Paceibacterota bacterium]
MNNSNFSWGKLVLYFFAIFVLPLTSNALISFPDKIDTKQERINIQTVLNTVMIPSPNLVIDGVLGKKSIQAIQAFQELLGLTPDGKVGPLTRSALESSQTNNITISSYSATSSSHPGCSTGALFSTITGKSCVSTTSGGITTSSTLGCNGSNKFSTITGASCTSTSTTKKTSGGGGGGGGGSSSSNTTTTTTCSGSSTQSCTITNGSGTQSRSCTNGSWGSWGTCSVSSCNSGYQISGNTCITVATGGCKSGEYLSAETGACLLQVPGNTYFVSTNGNDSNPGTFSQPFATWQRAVEASHPGDITYIRGGVYQPTTHLYGTNTAIGMVIDPVGYHKGFSGTAQAPIRYYAYPPDWNAGNFPILDGSLVGPNENRWNGGIAVDNAEYIYFKGLTVRNIKQTPPDFSHSKPYSEAFGIGTSGANFIFENMIVHDIDGRGFVHWSFAWNSFDGPGSLFSSNTTKWINCDAYNLYDRYAQLPGNAADGWKVHGYYGNNLSWEGCRAWNYSDDGFDPSGQAYRTFKNCWAMSTDKYKGLSTAWDIEGNGFKVTGINKDLVPKYVMGEKSFVTIQNSIAADNVGKGFVNNLLVSYDNNNVWPNGGKIYNNFAYNNDVGFYDAKASTLRNNISYKSRGIGPIGDKVEVEIYTEDYTESNNTWKAQHAPGSSWPWAITNPAYNVTDNDFISLDTSQLTRPRKADGSLPDITFGHLASGSDLINTGINVGLLYNGSAPDLGAFEAD